MAANTHVAESDTGKHPFGDGLFGQFLV